MAEISSILKSDVEGVLPSRSPLVYVASTGGHLAQLARLSKRLSDSSDSHWITFDSPQSRHLLSGQETEFVDYIAPRDWRAALRSAPQLLSSMRRAREKGAVGMVSTGAALAVPAAMAARAVGLPVVYIESVSRFDGPSLSGKMVSRIPGVDCYTQHANWASRKWKKTDAVLSSYILGNRPLKSSAPRVFVTLGTIKPYRFDRLVDSVKAIAGQLGEVTWQLGETNRDDLPGNVHQYMTGAEFEQASQAADVVITHAGVGTVLNLLDMGICPIVTPRRPDYDEHVDEHQMQIYSFLRSTGLATTVEANDLDISDVLTTASLRII